MENNYNTIKERMLEAAGFKNESELARSLKVTPQALSNYKKRGDMPSGLILKFASMRDLSLDWLVKGEGTPRVDGLDPLDKGIEVYKEQLKNSRALLLDHAIEPADIILAGYILTLKNESPLLFKQIATFVTASFDTLMESKLNDSSNRPSSH